MFHILASKNLILKLSQNSQKGVDSVFKGQRKIILEGRSLNSNFLLTNMIFSVYYQFKTICYIFKLIQALNNVLFLPQSFNLDGVLHDSLSVHTNQNNLFSLLSSTIILLSFVR